MGKSEIIVKAEKLVESAMKGNDASHDAAHAFRVRDLALSLAREEGLATSPDSMLIVELAALLHDIVYLCNSPLLSRPLFNLSPFNIVISRDPSEGKIVEDFLVKEGVDDDIKTRILNIIKGMGRLP
ncbi:UNVERIFIED_CONTAM: hypothetical protein Sradi_5652100 [Sesamum radiatum]|uniref:HD domain-containing protein n=1 Tax=Sesamum radiatum TaxID=300843 RepID=A0AAW2L125_SESRA